MKNFIVNFILTTTLILMITVLGIFGITIWNEINSNEGKTNVSDFKTVISNTNDTLDKKIETPNIIDVTIGKLTGTSTEKIDYSYIDVDKHFYNQLESEAQTIYKAFEANKENMKTGTYEIQFGNLFSDLLETENGQQQLGDYYQSAVEAYTYDNPDIFYISPNKMYLNVQKSTYVLGNTKYNVYINSGNEENYLVDEFPSQVYVEEAINAVEQVKNYLVSKRTGNTYEDIRNVHDFLVDTIDYDTSISQNNIYDIYGALIRRVCVCEGYARAFKYIMDEMGIPCVLVIGQATNSQNKSENHAWNYVFIGGSWYAIDSTWDDPVVLNGGVAKASSKNKYFLKGSATMNKDHTPNGQFTQDGKIFKYPTLNYEDY